MTIDWNKIPKEYDWLAKDDNWLGMVVGFENEPDMKEGYWQAEGKSITFIVTELEEYFETIDWKDSKTKRPE